MKKILLFSVITSFLLSCNIDNKSLLSNDRDELHALVDSMNGIETRKITNYTFKEERGSMEISKDTLWCCVQSLGDVDKDMIQSAQKDEDLKNTLFDKEFANMYLFEKAQNGEDSLVQDILLKCKKENMYLGIKVITKYGTVKTIKSQKEIDNLVNKYKEEILREREEIEKIMQGR